MFTVTLRVLYVEDDDSIRRAIERTLRINDVHYSSAASVADAVELAETFAFDALLTDGHLPDGTAVDLLARLDESASVNARRLSARAVILSGGGVSGVQAEAIKRGLHYLIKPAHHDTLLDALRAAAGRVVE